MSPKTKTPCPLNLIVSLGEERRLASRQNQASGLSIICAVKPVSRTRHHKFEDSNAFITERQKYCIARVSRSAMNLVSKRCRTIVGQDPLINSFTRVLYPSGLVTSPLVN